MDADETNMTHVWAQLKSSALITESITSNIIHCGKHLKLILNIWKHMGDMHLSKPRNLKKIKNCESGARFPYFGGLGPNT